MISSVRWLFARAGGELIARRVLVCALLIGAAAGCSDYPLSPHDQDALLRARLKWTERGSDDYTVEARIVCFCPPHLSYWTRLIVRGGVVVAAQPVESLPNGITPDLSGWLTIEEEFERLADPPDILESIRVRFDTRLGFPTYVSTDCGSNVADCGSVHEMRNVRFPAFPALRR